MAFHLANLAASVPWLVWPLLAGVAVLGLLALVSPARFARVANRSGRWVDTEPWLAVFDTQVQIDDHVLRHSRAFGLAVLLAAAVLAWCYLRLLA